jgi:uncharacterized protein (TIGR03435 family)
MPLDVIISYAFDISQQQIVGPKWLNEEVYEIEAIMPAGTKRQASRLMLQALLAERFGLQFHRETKGSRNNNCSPVVATATLPSPNHSASFSSQ